MQHKDYCFQNTFFSLNHQFLLLVLFKFVVGPGRYDLQETFKGYPRIMCAEWEDPSHENGNLCLHQIYILDSSLFYKRNR